jgi:hypothetical protein
MVQPASSEKTSKRSRQDGGATLRRDGETSSDRQRTSSQRLNEHPASAYCRYVTPASSRLLVVRLTGEGGGDVFAVYLGGCANGLLGVFFVR